MSRSRDCRTGVPAPALRGDAATAAARTGRGQRGGEADEGVPSRIPPRRYLGGSPLNSKRGTGSRIPHGSDMTTAGRREGMRNRIGIIEERAHQSSELVRRVHRLGCQTRQNGPERHAWTCRSSRCTPPCPPGILPMRDSGRLCSRQAIESIPPNLYACIRVCSDGNMTVKPQLIRYNVHLTPAQLKLLRQHRRATGVNVAEQIRRAVSAYLTLTVRLRDR